MNFTGCIWYFFSDYNTNRNQASPPIKTNYVEYKSENSPGAIIKNSPGAIIKNSYRSTKIKAKTFGHELQKL